MSQFIKFIVAKLYIVFPFLFCIVLKVSSQDIVPKIRIAVFDFKNNSEDKSIDYLGQALSESILTYFGKSGEVTVVERSSLNEIMEETKLALSGMVDEKTAAHVGKAAGANAVIIGSFTKIGNLIRINTRLVDAEKIITIAAEQVTGSIGTEIFSLMDKSAQSMLNQLFSNQIGYVNINTFPSDATVYINGKQIGTTPIVNCNLPVGKHQVTVMKKGFNIIVEDIYIEKNEAEILINPATFCIASIQKVLCSKMPCLS